MSANTTMNSNSSNDEVVHFRIGPNDRISIKSMHYTWVDTYNMGHVLQREDNPDIHETFTHEDVHKLLKSGDLESEPNYYSREQAALIAEQGPELLCHHPLEKQMKAIWRQSYCDHFLALYDAGEVSLSEASVQEAINTIAPKVNEHLASVEGNRAGAKITTRKPPEPSTLKRWVKRYRKHGRRPEALLENYCRSGNSNLRFDCQVEQILTDVANEYMDNTRPTRESLLKTLKQKVNEMNRERENYGQAPLKVPGKKALNNRIDALNPYQVVALRKGEEYARKKYAAIGEGFPVTRLLERVEMDENKIPLHILAERAGVFDQLAEKVQDELRTKRLWLCVAIDVRSRCILGAYLTNNPDTTSSLQTLSMVTQDKTALAREVGCQSSWAMYGTPETVTTDQGRSFTNDRFACAVTGLTGEWMSPPAAMPDLRGTVERFFGTMHTQLISLFHGRTFNNVVDKGDYDSEAHAVLTIEGLYRAIIRYIVDIYHNSPHEGLGGQTPADAWKQLNRKHKVALPPSSETCRHIFGTEINRSIQKRGIRVFGLWYQSKHLQELKLKDGAGEVDVRIDPMNVGAISVRYKRGWLSVPCTMASMEGVTLTSWVNTVHTLRQQYREVSNLSEEIVLQAHEALRKQAATAVHFANLSSPVASEADFEHLESKLFRGLDWWRGNKDASETDEEGAPDILEDDLSEDTPDQEVADTSSDPSETTEYWWEDIHDSDDEFFMED